MGGLGAAEGPELWGLQILYHTCIDYSPIWTDPDPGYFGEHRSLPIYQILILADFGSGYIRSIVVPAKFEQSTAFFGKSRSRPN